MIAEIDDNFANLVIEIHRGGCTSSSKSKGGISVTKMVEMKDPTGAVAISHIGFSVTVLLLGPLIPLFRGHLVAFAAMLGAYLLLGLCAATVFSGSIGATTPEAYVQLIAFGLNIAFAATYNSWHRSWLLKRGYLPVSAASELPDNRPSYVRDVEARMAASGKRP